HVDTFSLAVPPAYDPLAGVCTAYLTNDGGVFANTHGRGDACLTADGPWVRAESGLHTVAGFTLAGLAQGFCGAPAHPRTALYLHSADNGNWGTLRGGLPGTSWQSMECCGDTGSAYLDPALPGQMVTARNGDYHLFRTGSSRPPTKDDNTGNIAPPDAFDGI